MIQDIQRWQAFENDLISKQKPNYAENLRLVDGMYDLARKLGKFTAEDALDGLDNTIRLAAILHHVRSDLEDVVSVIRKNPKFNRLVVEKWLSDFDAELDGQFLNAFAQIMAKVRL